MPARRNRRRSQVATARRRRRSTPAWVLVIAGLLIGGLGLGTWSFVRGKLAPATQASQPVQAKPAPRPRPPSAKPPEKRFAFYDVLPNSEVVIPEEGQDLRPDKTPAPITAPGVYVLQAGSFGTFAEADRVKARLALLGISSQIQKITVDEREYHRVRIGPVEDLGELNRMRQRLRTGKVDVLVIRVGE